MLKNYFSFTILFFILICIFIFKIFSPAFPHYHTFEHSIETYFQTISKWSNSTPTTEKEKIKRFLYIIPFWFGTGYSFNGKSAVPFNGQISCGFFVNRVLNDMGYLNNVDSLSVLSANQIIKFHSKSENIFFSYQEVNNFDYIRSELNKKKFGLYLIGLDTHIGFLYNSGSEIIFIHSSSRFPYGVVSENMLNSKTIEKSNVIYLGKI